MLIYCLFFFFNDTATTEIYTLSLHDALPISTIAVSTGSRTGRRCGGVGGVGLRWIACRLICITRATAAAAKPRATSSRDRATRSLLPASQCFPRDLELVRLTTQRPLQLADPPTQLPLAAPLLLARQRFAAALEQLVAPGVEERVRDLVLAANLLDRAVAAQPGQHDLDLLLRRPAAVLPLLAQPSLLVGRAAHPEPAAGQSLRRYAPPGLPGTPTQLPVNAGPGSGADSAGRPSFCTRRVNPIARGYGRPLVGHPRPAPFASTAPARAARTIEERSLGVGPGGCALGYLLARLAVPAFLGRDRWHGPSGLIRRDRPRRAFTPRLGLPHLFLRPGRLALEGGGRGVGQIDEATGGPADAVEQLVAFLPDRLGVGLQLAHSRLRLLPQRRELFL